MPRLHRYVDQPRNHRSLGLGGAVVLELRDYLTHLTNENFLAQPPGLVDPVQVPADRVLHLPGETKRNVEWHSVRRQQPAACLAEVGRLRDRVRRDVRPHGETRQQGVSAMAKQLEAPTQPLLDLASSQVRLGRVDRDGKLRNARNQQLPGRRGEVGRA